MEYSYKKFFVLLQKVIRKVLENTDWDEIISAHLHPLVLAERQPVVLDKMRKIVGL